MVVERTHGGDTKGADKSTTAVKLAVDDGISEDAEVDGDETIDGTNVMTERWIALDLVHDDFVMSGTKFDTVADISRVAASTDG